MPVALLLLSVVHAISAQQFIWKLSSNCSRADQVPECNMYYNEFDAPLKADACLRESSVGCTISYSTMLGFEKEEMCANGRYLWIDLSLSNNWILFKDEPADLLAISADLLSCGNYSMASIDDTWNFPWCSIPPHLDYLPITFYDSTRIKIPNGIHLNTASAIVIKSPVEPKDCWISITNLSVFSVKAEYRRSTIGALDRKSSRLDEYIMVLVVGSTFIGSLCILSLMKKVFRAAFISRQETEVSRIRSCESMYHRQY